MEGILYHQTSLNEMTEITNLEMVGECDRSIKNLTDFLAKEKANFIAYCYGESKKVTDLLDKEKADYLAGKIAKNSYNIIMYQSKIEFHEIHLKMVRLEKIIYNALSKNNRGLVFPLFLDKYDELMGVSFDISSKSVNDGVVLEGTHLDYCRKSLEHREFIKDICDYGEHRTDTNTIRFIDEEEEEEEEEEDEDEDEDEEEEEICPYCERNETDCEAQTDLVKNPITHWVGFGLACDECYYKNHPESEDEDEEEEDDDELCDALELLSKSSKSDDEEEEEEEVKI